MKISKSDLTNKSVLSVKAVWYGILTSLGIWFVAVALGLLWSIIKGAGMYWLGLYIYMMGILGVFVGGIIAGRKSKKRGWSHGIVVGILLGILGLVVNLDLFPNIYTYQGIGRHMLVWSLWGLVGGQLGYYFKGKDTVGENRKIKGIDI